MTFLYDFQFAQLIIPYLLYLRYFVPSAQLLSFFQIAYRLSGRYCIFDL